jgi:hypothetical protein
MEGPSSPKVKRVAIHGRPVFRSLPIAFRLLLSAYSHVEALGDVIQPGKAVGQGIGAV